MPTRVRQLALGEADVDLDRREVRRGGKVQRLSRTECRLLAYLAERADTVVSTAELLEQVWGYDPKVHTQTVKVAMSRLRRKVDRPTMPDWLVTARGGYCLRRSAGRVRRVLLPPRPDLIGREDVCAELRSAMGSHRFVALCGPVGSGTTTIAVAVAAEVPCSAVYVDLAGRDPTRAVLEALGVQVTDHDPEAVCADVLAREGPVWLVVDHGRAEAARELDVWRRAPDLCVLWVGSQHARGSVRVSVPPMTDSEAARLFRTRAGRVRRHYPASDAQVSAIVAAVDYHPASVELAAGRTRVLGPDTLLQWLNRRTADERLVEEVGASSVAIQQALCALTAAEDGWTPEALGDMFDDRDAVVAPLMELEQRSWLTFDRRRLRLRRAVRQAVRQVLPAQVDAMTERHASWCLSVTEGLSVDALEAHRPQLLRVVERGGPEGVEALARLAPLLRRTEPWRVLQERIDALDSQTLPRSLLVAGAELALHQGSPADQWLSRLPPAERLRLAAVQAARRGDLPAAETYATEACMAAAGGSSAVGCHLVAGTIAVRMGRDGAAREHLDAASRLDAAPEVLRKVRVTSAQLHLQEGRADVGLDELGEVLDALRCSGDFRILAMALLVWARLAASVGRHDHAERALREAEEVAVDPFHRGLAACERALLAHGRGDARSARDLQRRGTDSLRGLADQGMLPGRLAWLALLHAEAGAVSAARRTLEEARARAEAQDDADVPILVEALARSVAVALGEADPGGDFPTMVGWKSQAMDTARSELARVVASRLDDIGG